MAETAQVIGPQLLKLFGMPEKDCIGIEIKCYVDELVTIKAEYYAGLGDTGELERTLKTFEVKEIKEE